MRLRLHENGVEVAVVDYSNLNVVLGR